MIMDEIQKIRIKIFPYIITLIIGIIFGYKWAYSALIIYCK